MIEIDGSYLEGGGQILRTACALSAITKKPCRVFNIRADRPEPGLMPQHLSGIQALAELYNGRLEGDQLGSKEIRFYPGNIQNPGSSTSPGLVVKIDTAGSITLALQTLMLPALFSLSPVKITFDGGATDTFFSPTIDYFRFVFLKILEEMDIRVEANIQKRGYYPEGGAKCDVLIRNCEIIRHNLNLTKRGQLKKISAISGASEFLREKKVAERQLRGVREILGKLKLPTEERIEYYQTQCPGSQVCLIAEFENTIIGTDNFGKLGKRAEDVGKEAALDLLKEQKTGACLDKHLADQILPYLALTGGKSQVAISEITDHCKTNIWVVEKFLEGKFEIKTRPNSSGQVLMFC